MTRNVFAQVCVSCLLFSSSLSLLILFNGAVYSIRKAQFDVRYSRADAAIRTCWMTLGMENSSPMVYNDGRYAARVLFSSFSAPQQCGHYFLVLFILVALPLWLCMWFHSWNIALEAARPPWRWKRLPHVVCDGLMYPAILVVSYMLCAVIYGIVTDRQARSYPLLFPPGVVDSWVWVSGWDGFRDLVADAPLWLPLYALVILAYMSVTRRRYRRDKGRCANCGYLLCGLPTARCPECGT